MTLDGMAWPGKHSLLDSATLPKSLACKSPRVCAELLWKLLTSPKALKKAVSPPIAREIAARVQQSDRYVNRMNRSGLCADGRDPRRSPGSSSSWR